MSDVSIGAELDNILHKETLQMTEKMLINVDAFISRYYLKKTMLDVRISANDNRLVKCTQYC